MFSHYASGGGGEGGGDRFIHFALAKIMTIHDVSPLPDELELIGRAEYAADSFLYSCIIRKYFHRAFLNKLSTFVKIYIYCIQCIEIMN
jgi:hypothetical protein